MATNATGGNAKFNAPSLSAYANNTTFNGLTLNDAYTMPSLPSVPLAFGVGAGQFNLASKLYTGSLVATTLLIDLTTLVDDKANVVNLARAKGVILLNYNVAAKFLKAGGAGSNPWVAPFGTVTDKIKVPPGYTDSGGNLIPGYVVLWAPDAAGLVTSSTSKVLQLDSGADTIAYAYALIGVDA